MLNDIPDDINPATVYGTVEWERRRLSSVPIPIRKAGGENFEVITPEEAKRRYMAIYRRNHPAPKRVVIARPKDPSLPDVKEKVASAAPDFVPPKFWTENTGTVPIWSRNWLNVGTRGESPVYRPKITTIIRITASYYVVSVGDILSQRRTANVMRPRQIAMYLAKTLSLRSLPYVGQMIGGRDHTTILHGVRKIARLIESGDQETISEVEAIRAHLGVPA